MTKMSFKIQNTDAKLLFYNYEICNYNEYINIVCTHMADFAKCANIDDEPLDQHLDVLFDDIHFYDAGFYQAQKKLYHIAIALPWYIT